MSEDDAYKSLRVTLHELRDNMTLHEAIDFSAQMPVLIKGIYFDNFSPGNKPGKEKDIDMISALHNEFGNNPNINPRAVFQKVINFLEEKISAGQMNHVKSNLPGEMQGLFQES